MKVTVGDVTNNKCDVREYLSCDEDGTIFVRYNQLDTVLIDKSEERDKLQSTIDDLSMAHDNLQRELADIKQRIGKDKHALIKSNISLNKKVQELKAHKEIYYKTLEKIGDPKNGWNPLAIEARIAIEKVGNLEGEE